MIGSVNLRNTHWSAGLPIHLKPLFPRQRYYLPLNTWANCDMVKLTLATTSYAGRYLPFKLEVASLPECIFIFQTEWH
jgi:hypothetical protein